MDRRNFLFGWTKRKPKVPETPSANVIQLKGDVVIKGTLQIIPPGMLNSIFNVGMTYPALTVNPTYYGMNMIGEEDKLELIIGERIDNG
jgi:hypothetical protein